MAADNGAVSTADTPAPSRNGGSFIQRCHRRLSSIMRLTSLESVTSHAPANGRKNTTSMDEGAVSVTVSAPSTSMALRSTHTERSLVAKKRVIVMLMCVVIEFFLFWTPLYVLNLTSTIVSPDVFKQLPPSI